MPSTSWTLIARLRTGDEGQKKRALNELCNQYHYPLYCYVRRRGLSHHDAQDALQDFFAKLLRNESFADADESRGRLRSLLLASLQRLLISRQEAMNVPGRDLGFMPMPELEQAAERYGKEQFAPSDTPDRVFDRRWAQTLLQSVLRRLREKYRQKGKEDLFCALQPVLLGGGSLTGHDTNALAQSTGMKPGTLRMNLHRLLEEYREALMDEVLQTVPTLDAAKQELRDLMTAFGS